MKAVVYHGLVDPSALLTQIEPIDSAVEAYQAFEQHKPGG
jgi:threonine dehydrogenase-like Zn-dependent dehydrogenase